MRKIVVAGIGTNVGKTIVSAIFVEALKADYWKPIQTGSEEDSDSKTIKQLISNKKTVIHKEAFSFKAPLSPHAAAALENSHIDSTKINLPSTNNHLIIEMAGGLLVPINYKELMIDLIQKWDVEIVLVSQNYLGSINHTLLSIEALRKRKCKILGVVFNGTPNEKTESAILTFGNVKKIGSVFPEDELNRLKILEYAKKMNL